MTTNTKYRKIGKVDVFEVAPGEQVSEMSQEAVSIKNGLNSQTCHGVLYNITQIESLSESTIDAMTTPVQQVPKQAVLAKSPALADQISRKESKCRLQMFQNERVATFYFASEFNEGRDPEIVISERRKFPRLDAARPLHFSYQNQEGERIHFFAIVTNISKSGLYAEFLEARSEQQMKKHLSVYDLQMLELELYIRPTESVNLRAKMVRINEPKQGIAMEFYESDATEKARFDVWMDEQHQKAEQGEGKDAIKNQF